MLKLSNLGEDTCNRYVQCIKWTFNDKKDRSESDEKTPLHSSLLGLGFLAAAVAILSPVKIIAGIENDVATHDVISDEKHKERGGKGRYVSKKTGTNEVKLQQLNKGLKVKRKLEFDNTSTTEVKFTSKRITRNEEVSIVICCIFRFSMVSLIIQLYLYIEFIIIL